MNVTLTQELEGIVKERMASGLYNSPAEVLREALRLIAERDWLLETQRELLRQDVQAGLDQLDRGELATPTAAQIKERVAARLRREQWDSRRRSRCGGPTSKTPRRSRDG